MLIEQDFGNDQVWGIAHREGLKQRFQAQSLN